MPCLLDSVVFDPTTVATVNGSFALMPGHESRGGGTPRPPRNLANKASSCAMSVARGLPRAYTVML